MYCIKKHTANPRKAHFLKVGTNSRAFVEDNVILITTLIVTPTLTLIGKKNYKKFKKKIKNRTKMKCRKKQYTIRGSNPGPTSAHAAPQPTELTKLDKIMG